MGAGWLGGKGDDGRSLVAIHSGKVGTTTTSKDRKLREGEKQKEKKKLRRADTTEYSSLTAANCAPK